MVVICNLLTCSRISPQTVIKQLHRLICKHLAITGNEGDAQIVKLNPQRRNAAMQIVKEVHW